MIIDKQNTLSDGQAITATAVSTNVLDLGNTSRSDEGAPVTLLAQVEAAFTAAGAATLTVTLETDDNEAFSSATVLLSTGAIPKATLVRGYQIPISFLPANCERYVRLNYTVATGPMTAGMMNAGIVLARQTNV
jgi:hypothetical protein